MARKPVYERYPLVFYREDKELYDKLKKASEGNRGSLRATILNALEIHFGKEGKDSTIEQYTNIEIEEDNDMGGW